MTDAKIHRPFGLNVFLFKGELSPTNYWFAPGSTRPFYYQYPGAWPSGLLTIDRTFRPWLANVTASVEGWGESNTVGFKEVTAEFDISTLGDENITIVVRPITDYDLLGRKHAGYLYMDNIHIEQVLSSTTTTRVVQSCKPTGTCTSGATDSVASSSAQCTPCENLVCSACVADAACGWSILQNRCVKKGTGYTTYSTCSTMSPTQVEPTAPTAPTSRAPTSAPTSKAPTTSPTTRSPTKSPVTETPTKKPTVSPSKIPTNSPSAVPSYSPTQKQVCSYDKPIQIYRNGTAATADGYRLDILDYVSGAYTQIKHWPYSIVNPPYANLNGCGINPRDSNLYCHVSRASFAEQRIVRIDMNTLSIWRFVAKVAFHSSVADFDSDGSFVSLNRNNRNLYAYQNLHTLLGFSTDTDSRITDKTSEPVWIQIPSAEYSSPSDLACTYYDLEGTGQKKYCVLVADSGWGQVMIVRMTPPAASWGLLSASIDGPAFTLSGGWGAGWAFSGYIFFGGTTGQGVMEVQLETANLVAKTIKVKRVGNSVAIAANDGVYCKEKVSPFATCKHKSGGTSSAVSNDDCSWPGNIRHINPNNVYKACVSTPCDVGSAGASDQALCCALNPPPTKTPTAAPSTKMPTKSPSLSPTTRSPTKSPVTVSPTAAQTCPFSAPVVVYKNGANYAVSELDAVSGSWALKFTIPSSLTTPNIIEMNGLDVSPLDNFVYGFIKLSATVPVYLVRIDILTWSNIDFIGKWEHPGANPCPSNGAFSGAGDFVFEQNRFVYQFKGLNSDTAFDSNLAVDMRDRSQDQAILYLPQYPGSPQDIVVAKANLEDVGLKDYAFLIAANGQIQIVRLGNNATFWTLIPQLIGSFSVSENWVAGFKLVENSKDKVLFAAQNGGLMELSFAAQTTLANVQGCPSFSNYTCAVACANNYKCCDSEGGRCVPTAKSCSNPPATAVSTCRGGFMACATCGHRCLTVGTCPSGGFPIGSIQVKKILSSHMIGNGGSLQIDGISCPAAKNVFPTCGNKNGSFTGNNPVTKCSYVDENYKVTRLFPNPNALDEICTKNPCHTGQLSVGGSDTQICCWNQSLSPTTAPSTDSPSAAAAAVVPTKAPSPLLFDVPPAAFDPLPVSLGSAFGFFFVAFLICYICRCKKQTKRDSKVLI
mmetsp:Transcript_25105/g.49408  ORF Transcript_25105/g.49408 Transcript_25105/m.49408 type:complete len:1157 (-) Transcript_25105:41-3511(-)